jgi:lactoylglutathione lyase
MQQLPTRRDCDCAALRESTSAAAVLRLPPKCYALPRRLWRETRAHRQWSRRMRYLHTMVRVKDLAASLDFYCDKLGLKEVRRIDNERGRFTLVFLTAPADLGGAADSPQVELTYNWDAEDYQGGRNFGHLAYRVGDIYAVCKRLMEGGVVINRPPRDGHMAFVRSPDGISVELLQEGGSLAPAEPWVSMPNIGSW